MVIQLRIRIPDHFSTSLTIAEYGILGALLEYHTVTGRFSLHSAKWLMLTRQWIYYILGAIWQISVSESGLIRKSGFESRLCILAPRGVYHGGPGGLATYTQLSPLIPKHAIIRAGLHVKPHKIVTHPTYIFAIINAYFDWEIVANEEKCCCIMHGGEWKSFVLTYIKR